MTWESAICSIHIQNRDPWVLDASSRSVSAVHRDPSGSILGLGHRTTVGSRSRDGRSRKTTFLEAFTTGSSRTVESSLHFHTETTIPPTRTTHRRGIRPRSGVKLRTFVRHLRTRTNQAKPWRRGHGLQDSLEVLQGLRLRVGVFPPHGQPAGDRGSAWMKRTQPYGRRHPHRRNSSVFLGHHRPVRSCRSGGGVG